MKKLFAAILAFALLLPVLAGCQNALATQQPTTESPLSREDALQLALEDAGLTPQNVSGWEVEPDWDNGTPHYDVDFEVDGKEYDYEIHRETGEILNKEVPPVTQEEIPQNTVGPMLREEAAAIAIAHAGLTLDQVYDLDVERDDKGGTPCYEVDFEADGYEYEYEIQAVTGQILYSHKERD